jgi:hypothetical protein
MDLLFPRNDIVPNRQNISQSNVEVFQIQQITGYEKEKVNPKVNVLIGD